MRFLSAIVLLAILLFNSACFTFSANRRQWIPNEKYRQAETIYDATGSLDLTEEQLKKDPTWQEPEIREALYRLIKRYELE